MARFDDRVFLISGGARGLGEAQARRLVAEGGRVVIADILVEQGRKLAAELGAAASFQALDVTSESQWRDAVAAAERVGKLHGLVNNAGVFAPLSIADTDVEMFERHMRVNQLGTFLGIKAVVPAFERTGRGVIVNLSSAAGLRGAPNTIAYTGTKWAVRGMTKTAAAELAPKKIRVVSVHPGPIDTDMMAGDSAEQTRQRTERVPLKRYGKADEIAGLVLFILSDEAAYMTGSEVAMDGGISL